MPSVSTALASAPAAQVGPSSKIYDVGIIGAGPSGLSAAIYASSEGLDTLLIEKSEHTGGQMFYATKIENYAGFSRGVTGANLAQESTEQALKFGTALRLETEGVSLTRTSTGWAVTCSINSRFECRTIITALGVSWRKLRAEGIDPLIGHGVYYGQGAILPREHDRVVIVGGGNSSAQLAMYLSERCREVIIIVRRPLEATASAYLTNRIHATGNIVVLDGAEVQACVGSPTLESIVYRRDGADAALATQVMFVMIGTEPHAEFLRHHVECDDLGFVSTNTYDTTAPGIFAVGDVRQGSVKRVATAIGDGAGVISRVHAYLSSLEQRRKDGL